MALPPGLDQAVLLLVLSDLPPTPAALKAVCGQERLVLARLCLDRSFVLNLPKEQAGDVSIMRLSADWIPKINLNLRSAIEILRGADQ
jgi:hypothetical protein